MCLAKIKQTKLKVVENDIIPMFGDEVNLKN
jgi:hypothetical protein